MKESLYLKVLGQKVPLRTSDRDNQKIKEVLGFVQEQITKAEARCKPNSPAFQPLLLALLDLAEVYLSAKKKVGEHQADFARASQRITEMLEKELH